ncbi:MAG: tetratricopeptide repeat protein [Nitrospiraceae bacterium]|nr:tetratricopeptide repeat protein [Nitrospiraceae bacterium]
MTAVKNIDARTAFQEGQLLLIEGKFKEGVEAFSRALDAGADPFMCYLARGAAYLRLKEMDEAISDFSSAIEKNSSSHRPFYYRAMAYMVKGDFQKAVQDFSRALELKPEVEFVRFSRAVALSRLGRADEAVEDFKEVIPAMETNLEAFADEYGIVKTEMWRVMNQLTGEAGETPALDLSEDELQTLKKWLSE